mmetsp:Transcript_31853/g.74481  ORF Transcript_31853/g.74481 Transcript_31853/m.74481 type:complete len:239 (-) Transcript_31853:28-744(-)
MLAAACRNNTPPPSQVVVLHLVVVLVGPRHRERVPADIRHVQAVHERLYQVFAPPRLEHSLLQHIRHPPARLNVGLGARGRHLPSEPFAAEGPPRGDGDLLYGGYAECVGVDGGYQQEDDDEPVRGDWVHLAHGLGVPRGVDAAQLGLDRLELGVPAYQPQRHHPQPPHVVCEEPFSPDHRVRNRVLCQHGRRRPVQGGHVRQAELPPGVEHVGRLEVSMRYARGVQGAQAARHALND